ncbi:tetratricopeptide repeat-containing sulfotransferase family protein [Cognatilysobacter segetis]|uniref:tetratricopeptide repeat-containing sulfotransferase family protein n=1 Tax=Cognatilysobacter segetis TaxID=2492394 RepID=UPI00139026CB|nr:sulfotransferase [Lysobacter segetis]
MNDPSPSPSSLAAAFERGDWPTLYRLAGEAARHAPDDPALHYLAGLSAIELGHAPLAVAHLQRTPPLWPRRPDVGALLARALAECHRMDEAARTADALFARDDLDAATLSTLGTVYSRANLHEPALRAFQRTVDIAPQRAQDRFNLATSLLFFGRIDEAEAQLRACLDADPAYWRAYLALAQLRRQSDGAWIERMQAIADAHPRDPDAQLHLHLAIAKSLEDAGRFSEAFGHYVRGKAPWHARLGSSRAADAAVFDSVRRAFEAIPPDARGARGDAPIFVIGLPRTGTTLVDRILSRHPDVASGGELGHFGAALQRAAGGAPRSLAELIDGAARIDDWSRVGQDYLDATRALAGGRPRLVDKLPHNFLFAGFIARALPDARILCLRRQPMDAALSNFRQLFAPESPYHGYSFDLLDTGAHVIGFERLMAFWHAALPGRVLDVPYEHLVADPEAWVRRMLEFCGLAWHPDCLDFSSADGAVPTASAAQVREPLNDRSIGRWRRYGDALQPLRDQLAAAGLDTEAGNG